MSNEPSAKTPYPSVLSDLLKKLREVEKLAKSADENFPDELERIAALREKLRNVAQPDAAGQRSPKDRSKDREALEARMQALQGKIEQAKAEAGL